MKRRRILTMLVLALVLVFCLSQVGKAVPMGTAWTYQGRLLDANDTADGIYDFEFELYDAPNGGVQEGNTIDVNDLDVINGYFTVELDFGSGVFDGDALWLAIGVRPGDSNNLDPFVTLSPRQEVTPTPYALYAKSTGNALTGGGTTNRIAKFTGPNTLGDSALYEHNYYVGVGTTNPRGMFDVDCDGGDIYLDTFSSQIYIGDVDGDGDETIFTVDDSAGKFTFENGKVGIGTTTPQASLEVTNAGTSHAIWASTSDIPVYAHRIATAGTWPAVAGDCNSEANGASGVRGRILSTSPGSLGAGVYGYNYGTGSNGVGVRGHHAGSGTGVYGRCDNGFGGYFVGAKNYFAGNVGIGTTSPGAGLHLKGDGYPGSFMHLQSNSGQDTGIRLYEGDTEQWHIFNSSSAGGLMVCNNAFSPVLFADQSTGKVGIGTNSPTKKLTVRGNILVQSESTGASVAEIGEGLDYAEGFEVTEDADIEAGMVLVIDSENPGKLALSRSAYDSKVAGIVAGANGIGSGVRLGVGQFDYDVALAGRVYCNVDATVQAVQAGDLLTTSATPGYAMKVTDYDRARGAILGKAMQKLQQGQKGQILVLVTLQ